MPGRCLILLAAILLLGGAGAGADDAAPSADSQSPSGLPLSQVVRLDTSRQADDRRGVGVGFFVASDRVATCWHVLAPWDEVQLQLQDGTQAALRGVIGVSKELDLALLELKSPVNGAGGLEFAPAAAPAKQRVWAIGHPRGEAFVARPGILGREIRTSQLAARPQVFIREKIGRGVDHRWLQHSAPLTDGDSGGPLLDARFRLLGVNTWVDDSTHTAYALHSAQLAEFLKQPTFDPRSLAAARDSLKPAR